MFWEADNHPVRPHTAFCYFLHMSACCGFLFGFLPQAGFPCFSKLFPNRCWDVLLPEAKLYHCPHTPAKSGNSRATKPIHADPATPAQRGAAIGEFFCNKITSNYHKPSETCDSRVRQHSWQYILSVGK